MVRERRKAGDFSLLEYHIIAPHEYHLPGGSCVEHILEAILRFAVLMCFLVVAWPLAITDFIVQTLGYRYPGIPDGMDCLPAVPLYI